MFMSGWGLGTMDRSGGWIAASETVTITAVDGQLPPATNKRGRIYIVKSTGTVVMTVQGGGTIDGAASYTIDGANKGVAFLSDGTNWVTLFEEDAVAAATR